MAMLLPQSDYISIQAMHSKMHYKSLFNHSSRKVTLMENREVLETAATLVAESGLAKRSFETPQGQHCTMGAISASLQRGVDPSIQPDSWWDEKSTRYRELSIAVAKLIDPNNAAWELTEDQVVGDLKAYQGGVAFSLITEWNDSSERQKQDVVDILSKAATTF